MRDVRLPRGDHERGMVAIPYENIYANSGKCSITSAHTLTLGALRAEQTSKKMTRTNKATIKVRRKLHVAMITIMLQEGGAAARGQLPTKAKRVTKKVSECVKIDSIFLSRKRLSHPRCLGYG